MNLLSMADVSLTLSHHPLFSDVSFGIDAGDRIGFVGPNGAGKSTFLSLLTGMRPPDTGEIIRRGGLTVATLPQMPQFAPGATVADLVFRSDDHRARLAREYESFMAGYDGSNPEDLAAIQARMDEHDAWNIEDAYRSFLTELGICDLTRRADTLSGGELRKADLARVLASGADLLLLDEPTNHLDLETVEWLETWLRNGKRSYVLATHDRSFLENCCDAILELDEGTVRKHPGSWNAYLSAKAKREEEEAKSADKRANILRREVEWASRQPRARASKDKKRLMRLEELQDAPQADMRRMTEFSARGRRLGKKVLELVEVSKTRGERQVLKPFSYSFRRGERIGIAGPNGAGKTTFLSVATGLLSPDSGRVDPGVNTRFAVLDQSPLAAKEDSTVLEYMREQADNVVTAEGGTVDVPGWLERFGFSGAAQRRKIRYLSGGEKRRLQLVRLLMKEPNFLVLDEPTNDLDLATLSLLETFLEEYGGCLLVVSHDRTFLERVVDYYFVLDGKGSVRGFSGSWNDFRESEKERQKEEQAAQKETEKAKNTASRNAGRQPKKGLTFKERKEMEALWEEVMELEAELETIEAMFTKSSPNPEELAEASKRHGPLKDRISERTARWEELAEKDE